MTPSDSIMKKFLSRRDPEQIGFRILVLVCLFLEYF